METELRLIDQVIALKRCCQAKEDTLRESLGLSASDYHCLSSFPQDKPISGNDLAKRLGLSPSRMSRVAEGLVSNGYLRREQDPTDRRIQHYTLTAKGAKFKMKIQAFLDDCEAELQKRLSRKVAKEVECGLRALNGVLAG